MEPQNYNSGFLINKIITELGFGRSQLLNYVLIIYMLIFISISQNSFLFASLDTSYRCQVPECESSSNVFEPNWLPNAIPYANGLPEKCIRYVPLEEKLYLENEINYCPANNFNRTETQQCCSWIYGEGYTIIREFEIPCHKWKGSLVGTASCLGQLVSFLLTGFIADKYGRRIAIVFISSFGGLIGLAQSFSPEYWSFIVMEFLKISFSTGSNITAFILGIEMIEEEKRVFASTVLNIFMSIGMSLTGLVAWLCPYWRSLLRASSVPVIMIVFSYCFVIESIPWLLTKGKTIKAIYTIKSVAKTNNVALSRDVEMYLNYLLNNTSVNKKNKKMRNMLIVRLLKCAFCWMGIASTYFGLTIYSVYVGIHSDPYLQFTLTALVDIPGCIIFFFVVKCVGRKLSVFYSVIVCGAICAIISFTPVQYSLTIFILHLTAKLFISLAMSVNFFYTSEMYPTECRNTFLSICFTAASIGSAVIAQVLILAREDSSLPYLIFTGLCLIVSVLVIKLPSTVRLAHTFDDVVCMK